MLSVIVQHSNGSVPKRCSGREKDQRSAFTGAKKIQSQTRWSWCKGSPPWKVHFKNLFVPPQGSACRVSAAIQDDCTTFLAYFYVWTRKFSFPDHSALVESTFNSPRQRNRAEPLNISFSFTCPVIPHWRLWHLFISLLATGFFQGISVLFTLLTLQVSFHFPWNVSRENGIKK